MRINHSLKLFCNPKNTTLIYNLLIMLRIFRGGRDELPTRGRLDFTAHSAECRQV
jgi:hypothetical protein